MSSRAEITVVSYFEGRLPGGNSPRPPCPGPSRRRGPSRPVQAPRPVPARPGDSGSSCPGPAPARPGVSGTGQAMGGGGGALGKSGLQVPHGFVDCDGKPAVLCVVCGTRLVWYHRHLICCSDECDRKAIHGDLLRTTLRPGIRARGPGEPGPGDRGGVRAGRPEGPGPGTGAPWDRGPGDGPDRGARGPGPGTRGRAGLWGCIPHQLQRYEWTRMALADKVEEVD